MPLITITIAIRASRKSSGLIEMPPTIAKMRITAASNQSIAATSCWIQSFRPGPGLPGRQAFNPRAYPRASNRRRGRRAAPLIPWRGEPVPVEAVDHGLGQADRVRQGLVLDIGRGVPEGVVVGRLLQLGAGAERGQYQLRD